MHDAAVALFADVGIDGFTMEALAERSGVARSTIYRHWPDRAELLAGVFVAVSPVVDDDPEEHLVERLSRRAWTMATGMEQEWGRLFPFVVAAAQHDRSVRDALDRFNAQRRGETMDVIEQAAERGEVELPEHLDWVLDRYIAPFFLRMLVTGEPIEDDFVEFQLERVFRELGLTSEDLAGRISRAR